MNKIISRATLAMSVLCLSLAACGGGGGGGDTDPTALAALSQAQGIWEGTGSSGLAASALVLPDGAVWLVLAQGDQPEVLVRGTLVVQGTGFSGRGSRYVFNPVGKTSVSINADARAQSSLSLRVAESQASDSLQMTYQPRYESTLSVDDMAGPWRGVSSDGVVAIDWTIAQNGIIEGKSSTGCTYSGSLSSRPEARAVINASLTETCADGVVTLNGVATLAADRSRANIAFTSTDANAALLLNLQRRQLQSEQGSTNQHAGEHAISVAIYSSTDKPSFTVREAGSYTKPPIGRG